AGLAFFVFAAWTFRGDTLSAAEERRATQPSTGSVIVSVGIAFVLAEIGDKTMLATVALATHEDALGTWLGSTAGMVAADAIAIGIGRVLGQRLPERAIRVGATVAFVAFGVILLWEGLSGAS
ncbi:MAG TPA: TMEM165/GDT1 family protein, partial [Candidatus Limnocylindrales bacterium]